MPRKKTAHHGDLASAQARDWRNLKQSVSIGRDTESERRLRRNLVFQWAFVLVLAGAIAGLFVYTWRDMMAESSAEDASSLAVSVEFVNKDGVLNEAWMRAWTNFDASPDASSNLNFLRRRLLEYPQIRDARVERAGERKICISVRERRPVARLVSVAGEVRLVASDGVIFPAETFPPSQSMLPELRDAKIFTEKESGFECVAGISTLAEFIDLARVKYPSLYVDWDVISLKDFPADAHDLAMPWSVFRVTPKESSQDPTRPRIEEIVFSASRFREDLRLLAAAQESGEVASALAGTQGGPRFVSCRVLFITNRKDPKKEFREMRIVPISTAGTR